MLKEIYEQPEAVAETIGDGCVTAGSASTGLGMPDDELLGLKRIVILAMRHGLPRGRRRPAT